MKLINLFLASSIWLVSTGVLVPQHLLGLASAHELSDRDRGSEDSVPSAGELILEGDRDLELDSENDSDAEQQDRAESQEDEDEVEPDSDSEPEIENDSDGETEAEVESEAEPANSDSESEDEIESDSKSEREDEKSPAAEKAEQPSPEEVARLNKLAIADQLYLGGEKAMAIELYREAKEPWQIERVKDKIEAREVFDDPAQLSPAGRVFWRNYQEGKEQQLESKVLSPLKLLTTREPQFLPGHIAYATALLEYDRPDRSQAVLNRAVNLYPNEPTILRAKMDAEIALENWLDASIMARQYALFNPDAPDAAEFEQLADEYLAEYQSKLKSDITWNAVGNAIAGTVGFALTGNIFGPLSALETTALLLQGESAVGEASVSQIKKQVPLLQDEAVTEYIDRIGQRIAAASGREEFDYQFYVIMDNNLNAFALPGGKIFINAGAIMKTDSEAELAGLLAHEVSHSALSHGFQLVTKGNLTSNIVSYIPYVGNTASSLIVLNYSRGMEQQADVFGTRILVNAGYAADGVRNLMAQLDESRDKDNPEPPAWLSTHPNTRQRISYVEQLVVEQNLDRYAYEGVYPHRKIKQIIGDRWKKYEKCIAEIETIEEAKACAGEKESDREAEEYKESEAERDRNEPELEAEMPEADRELDSERE